MKKLSVLLLFAMTTALVLVGCKKTTDPTPDEPMLVFKIKFDSTQQRLDAFAQPATIPTGNAAQHPEFNNMSIHNIELVPNELTAIKAGDVVYLGAETTTGGNNAVDFDQAIVKGDGEVFFEIPLSQVTAGTYEYIRTSVTYQNYDVYYNINNIPFVGDLNNQKGTVASFVGFNTYITNLTVGNMDTTINNDKLQGFWAFETALSSPYDSYNKIYAGDAAATTVVNPVHNTTPIPQGSCLVTGSFTTNNNLVITGEETEDVVIELSYCTNKSFEWQDDNSNGELDIDASSGAMEAVVDMGLRGLQATKQ